MPAMPLKAAPRPPWKHHFRFVESINDEGEQVGVLVVAFLARAPVLLLRQPCHPKMADELASCIVP